MTAHTLAAPARTVSPLAAARRALAARQEPRLVVQVGEETFTSSLHPKQMLSLARSLGDNVTSEVGSEVKQARISRHDTYMVCFASRDTAAFSAFAQRTQPFLAANRKTAAVRELVDFLSVTPALPVF